MADEARGTIFVYTGDDRPPSGWLAEPGGASSDQRFREIRGIVASTGLLVYVLDSAADRVYQYDLADEAQGTVLDLAGATVSARFGTVRGSALGLDPSGQPVVADSEGDRLLVFDPHWAPRFEIGGPGSSRGTFRDPCAIAWLSDGRCWVADRGNRLMQLLDPAGAFLAEEPFEHPPESVTIDRKGNLFVGDAAGVVTLIRPDRSRAEYPPEPGAGGTAYVTVKPDGSRLYVARPVAGRVDVYDIQGAPSGS